MRLPLAIVFTCTLAACGSEPTPEEQAKIDAKAIAEVEANQTPPPDVVSPQILTNDDFETHAISGLGCSFAPSGGGDDPVAVTLVRYGFMKIDDAVERFAPDAGSAESAFGTRVKYDSGRHSMRLELDDGDGEAVGTETVVHDARLIVKDGRDRTVYEARGEAFCGA